MLGPGALALQETLDVTGHQLPLHRTALLPARLFDGGDPVTSGFLGNVHAGVGGADNVFRGQAVHRETGHTKAPCDVVLAEHGVRRQPQAQALGEDLGLLDSGFRHQDDEFVSAVACDYVRLPAFLLQQAADTGQNHVAFQVAVGIVDFLEFVEVHQHHRERAAGAGGAFPF